MGRKNVRQLVLELDDGEGGGGMGISGFQELGYQEENYVRGEI